VTLQFFSTRAYNYVREIFDLELPHITTVRQWLKNVDGKPGFTQQVISTLKAKVDR